jgi:hypothetical protein
VTSFVRRDRLETGCLPCLVGAGADGGGEERLGLGAAEDEVRTVAVRLLLVSHQFAADDERHRDGVAKCFVVCCSRFHT